jgi:formiminotetrahydrofolate cyclodeaminase
VGQAIGEVADVFHGIASENGVEGDEGVAAIVSFTCAVLLNNMVSHFGIAQSTMEGFGANISVSNKTITISRLDIREALDALCKEESEDS